MNRRLSTRRMFFWTAVFAVGISSSVGRGEDRVTAPVISEEICPVRDLRVDDTSYAVIRNPPTRGPFPAVIFLHGGLGQSSMQQLHEATLRQVTQRRFLAWGYVVVNATRRSIQHDPLDRGVVSDTLKLIDAVRKLPCVDQDSIVLYGGSGGGTLALEVASVSDRVVAVAAGEPATIIYMGMFNKSHVIWDDNGKVTGDRRWNVMNADPRELYTDELKEFTRRKMRDVSCPVLILHGDQHALKKFNFDVFIPELRALGKHVLLKTYPGEQHGFYWGRSDNPAMPLKANRDADSFFRKYLKTQPQPIENENIKFLPVS